jgi:predicted hotdog family 3-hydroxylacyl-ACP dehydratase
MTNVLEFLPQRPPFVMVDKLLSVDDKSACTEFVVSADNIFTENGTFSEAGMIENMAQTCAAGMGYVNVCMYENTVKIGFLSAVRNLQILRLPKVGETLNTCVYIVENVMDMILVRSEIKIKDEPIAEGEMKIFITNMDNEKNT